MKTKYNQQVSLVRLENLFPSLLMDGRLGDDILHVVVAFDEVESHCYIITAYKPDMEHFENDLKTRRKL